MFYPVADSRITQHFGRTFYNNFHEGTDIVSRSGNFSLYAISRGKVATKNFHPQGGYYVIIKHPWIDDRTYETYYGHLEKPSHLRVGQRVKEGDKVGVMGDTGLTTGRHVHFETRIERGKVDPELFMENLRLIESIRDAYIALYEVFLDHTPSDQDVKNFIEAGEDFRREYGYVKERLG